MRKGYTVQVIYPHITDAQWFGDDIDEASNQFGMHVILATNCTPPVATDCILLIRCPADNVQCEIIKRWTAKEGSKQTAIPYND